MKSFKIRLIPIISLAAAALICIGAFFGLTVASADRTVTPSGASSSYTFTTVAGAEVWSHEVVGQASEGETALNEYYTMFVLKSDNDSVNYRKNLAYQWFYNSAAESDDEETAAPLVRAAGLFNTVIGFEANDDGT
ncbi:MAG: hypothetical protein K2N30_02140, partial [Clostridia bacterium]|nr:hypothetical protein [Clostridia bacterium]